MVLRSHEHIPQLQHQTLVMADGGHVYSASDAVQAVARDARAVRNRMVLRAHERLARLRTKAKGDDRAQRLEALKVCLICQLCVCARGCGKFL